MAEGAVSSHFSEWGKSGWLASPAYRAFWSGVLARELRPFLAGKSIADIGAGKAAIWPGALEILGLTRLQLIDPYLDVDGALAAHPLVVCSKAPLESLWPSLAAEVLFFKQSFHFAYAALGAEMFRAGTLITLSMPKEIGWPVSQRFRQLYAPTHLDIAALARAHGKTIAYHQPLSFAVSMPRDTWVAMLRCRFVSCLHQCDDAWIEEEVRWANVHLPQVLAFDDTLECVVAV
jgi:hypothetical protein